MTGGQGVDGSEIVHHHHRGYLCGAVAVVLLLCERRSEMHAKLGNTKDAGFDNL